MPHVTFIHGIANKPPKDKLLQIWKRALAQDDGVDLDDEGVTSSMIYWADVMYENPSESRDAHESTGQELATSEDDEDMQWVDPQSRREREFLENMTEKLGFDAEAPDDDFAPAPGDEDGKFERIPLPWFVKRRIMKVFLRDVHHYLFNSESTPREGETFRVRDEIRDRFQKQLTADAEGNLDGKHIIIAHSMGTVISYDNLKRIPECSEVDALFTVGSPLGLDEVQDKLRPGYTRRNGFPGSKILSHWTNYYDRLDPVAGLDAKLANDYRHNNEKRVGDTAVHNPGLWRHDVVKYLAQPEFQEQVRETLEL